MHTSIGGAPAATETRSLLRTALLLDGLASGAMGIALAVAARPLAPLFGLPLDLLRGAELALLPFAVVVGWLGWRKLAPAWAVAAVVAVNAAWVVASLLLLVAGWAEPTPLGAAAIVAQALVVAAFAGLQASGLRRMTAGR